MPLKKRRKKKADPTSAEAVRKGVSRPRKKKQKRIITNTISTGSTLLDLNISGGVIRGGGIPGGIIMEVYGPHSAGKTAILSELCASAQVNGGDVHFSDPEARLNKEYCRTYGMEIDKSRYSRPDTVEEMFRTIWDWNPRPRKKNSICVLAEDSLAALSTKLEMDGEDKMGMRRAKMFSEGLRKSARLIAQKNWIIACSNQERDGQMGGPVTPGGRGIPYYASLRMRIKQHYPKGKILKTRSVGSKGRKVNKVIGIWSDIEITKSSLDEPFRITPVYIIFGHGIDDVRANLQWMKDMTGTTKYDAIDKKFGQIEPAIKFIEDYDLEGALREEVIDMWEEIQEKFRVERKKKKRH